MTSSIRVMFIICISACCCEKQGDDLLEKVTQLEIFARKIRHEVLEVRNEVESKLSVLRRKYIDILQCYFDLKKQMPKKMDTALVESGKRVKELIQNLKIDRRDLRLKVSSLERLHKTEQFGNKLPVAGSRDVPDIAFRANMPQETRFNGNRAVMFTNVFENAGQGYDKGTGVFTAPVTGTYLFVFNLYLGGYVDLAIMKNKDLYSWARFFPYYVSCQNLDLITTMEAGDTVFVRHISSWYNSVMYDKEGLKSAFSGVLIS